MRPLATSILLGIVLVVWVPLVTSADEPTFLSTPISPTKVPDIQRLPPSDFKLKPVHRMIIVVVVATILVISSLGNGFLVHRFVKQKRYRTPTNRLIISQCAADLVLTWVTMPLAIVSHFTESGRMLPYPFDLIQIFSMRLFMTVSVLNLSILAVDRISALSKHDVTSTLSNCKASTVAALSWLLSILMSAPLLEICGEGAEHYRRTLNTDFGLLRRHETTGEMIMTAPALRTIILGCVSVCVALYCFVKVIFLICSRKAESSPSALCDSGQIRSVRLRVRSAYTVALVFMVFFLSTIPFYTMFILTISNVSISWCAITAAKLVSWTSTATKPFIYIMRCKKWQGRRLVTRLRGKLTLDDVLKKKTPESDEINFFSQPAIDFAEDNAPCKPSDTISSVEEDRAFKTKTTAEKPKQDIA